MARSAFFMRFSVARHYTPVRNWGVRGQSPMSPHLSYNPRNAMIKTAISLVLVAMLQTGPAADPVTALVGRLDLEKYKTTIKGLTQFGDRRQGTDRNRAAVDWIEVQLKSYGCTNTERIKYEYNGRQLRNDSTNRVDSARAAANPNPPAGRGGAGRGGRGGR